MDSRRQGLKQLGGRGGFARWAVHRRPLAVIY